MKYILIVILIYLVSGCATSSGIGELNDQAIESFNNQQVDEAFSLINEAIRLDSNFSLSYYNRGVMNRDIGEIVLAIDDFTTCLTISPEDTDALISRGIIYASREEYDEALLDFNKLILLDSTNKEALFNIGLVEKNKDRFVSAENYFKRSLVIDSTYNSALFQLAQIRAVHNDINGCLRYMDKIITNGTEIGDHYFWRSLLYFEKELDDLGCLDLSKAIELGTEDTHAQELYENKCK